MAKYKGAYVVTQSEEFVNKSYTKTLSLSSKLPTIQYSILDIYLPVRSMEKAAKQIWSCSSLIMTALYTVHSTN